MTTYGLDSILYEIEGRCENIQSLKFQLPGIFTNAIITKPPITKLLKDAAEHEQALYRITKTNGVGIRSSRESRNERVRKTQDLNEYDTIELKPERIDGKSIYIDNSFHGFAEDNENHENTRRTAVRVPAIVKDNVSQINSESESDQLSSPTKSSHHYNLIPDSILESDNTNALCSLLTQLIEKYPMLVNKEGLYEDINNYQQEFNQLLQEIKELEDVVAEQRSQLNYYNINTNDFGSPSKASRGTEEASNLEEIDIEELIRREELEIEQLEHELNDKTA